MNSLAAGHEVLQASGRPFPSWCPNMPRTHTKAYLGFDQSDHQCVVLLSNPFKNNKKRKNSKSWINLHGVKKKTSSQQIQAAVDGNFRVGNHQNVRSSLQGLSKGVHQGIDLKTGHGVYG